MTRPYYKKPYKEKFADAFTRSFGQIYSQYSMGEKVGYWIIVVAGFSLIAYLGLK